MINQPSDKHVNHPPLSRHDERWEAYRDGTLSDEQRARFEECLARDEQAADLFARESQWLAMLGEDERFDDADAFTDRVVARWAETPRGGVLGRIGHRKMAAIGIAWAALLALVVGLSQTAWWGGTTMPANTHSRPAAHPVSTLLEHANRRYDEQAMRVTRMLDQSGELINPETFVYMLVEPVSRGRFTAPVAPNETTSSDVQPVAPNDGSNR